jgi:AGCS family alanine or glycine:cation symporter
LLWLIADVLNGLMALPNLVAILLLIPIVIKTTREYFAKPMQGAAESTD